MSPKHMFRRWRGDGGHGGNVVIVADAQLSLIDYRYKHHFRLSAAQ